MKVTICELPDQSDRLKNQWEQLLSHLQQEGSELLLLPELIFSPWIAVEKNVASEIKAKNLSDHEYWIKQLELIKDTYVVYSKPVMIAEKFHNTAFVWHSDFGHTRLHTKSYFPEEPQFWEESVYDKEDGLFEAIEVGNLRIGILLCTEMWFSQHAREYGHAGIDLLLCPRATGLSSVVPWTRCGQTLAIISGAYCLSSNRSGVADNSFHWGGGGWVAAPMTGELLGQTDEKTPFLTVDIDLTKSHEAKNNYPLTVLS